jgi:hypothetical protein
MVQACLEAEVPDASINDAAGSRSAVHRARHARS